MHPQIAREDVKKISLGLMIKSKKKACEIRTHLCKEAGFKALKTQFPSYQTSLERQYLTH